MNYGDYERLIAQRINDMFSELGLSGKFFAMALPETDKEQKDCEAQLVVKSCAVVEFIDTEFQLNTTNKSARQVETPKFRLLFSGKRLRGDDGLFSLINYCKEFLLGYSLPNTTKVLTLSGFGKIQYEPGVWVPFVDLQTEMLIVQVIEPDMEEIGGAFTSILRTPDQATGEFEEETFS